MTIISTACDMCQKPAAYDAITKANKSALLCESCFQEHGLGLGDGTSIPLKPSIILPINTDVRGNKLTKFLNEKIQEAEVRLAHHAGRKEALEETLTWWKRLCPDCGYEAWNERILHLHRENTHP